MRWINTRINKKGEQTKDIHREQATDRQPSHIFCSIDIGSRLWIYGKKGNLSAGYEGAEIQKLTTASSVPYNDLEIFQEQ